MELIDENRKGREPGLLTEPGDQVEGKGPAILGRNTGDKRRARIQEQMRFDGSMVLGMKRRLGADADRGRQSAAIGEYADARVYAIGGEQLLSGKIGRRKADGSATLFGLHHGARELIRPSQQTSGIAHTAV